MITEILIASLEFTMENGGGPQDRNVARNVVRGRRRRRRRSPGARLGPPRQRLGPSKGRTRPETSSTVGPLKESNVGKSKKQSKSPYPYETIYPGSWVPKDPRIMRVKLLALAGSVLEDEERAMAY